MAGFRILRVLPSRDGHSAGLTLALRLRSSIVLATYLPSFGFLVLEAGCKQDMKAAWISFPWQV